MRAQSNRPASRFVTSNVEALRSSYGAATCATIDEANWSLHARYCDRELELSL